MSDETIDIPDITDEQARAELAVHLLKAGFESYGSGVWWELPQQTITVLLTEKHNDVSFYGEESLRLHYDTPQILLGDWETLMGAVEEGGNIREVIVDPDASDDYQRDPEPEPAPEPEARSGF